MQNATKTAAYPKLGLFIGGEWKDGTGRKAEPVINPASEKTLTDLPHATRADLDEALQAAKQGFEIWRKTTAWDRARVMCKAADIMRERLETIAAIITQEQGKPLFEARLEVTAAADVIQWMAEEGKIAHARFVTLWIARTRNTRGSFPTSGNSNSFSRATGIRARTRITCWRL